MPDKRENAVNVGIDVGKHQLDVAIHERNLHFSMPNHAQSTRTQLARLARHRLARIVVEATGRREYGLVLAATERGFPVIMCQSVQGAHPQRWIGAQCGRETLLECR